MFVGALPKSVRLAIFSILPPTMKIAAVGCSGNFGVELMLSSKYPGIELHSNDVSFYSTLLGEALSGNSLLWTITDSRFHYLNDGMKDPLESTATGIFLYECSKYLDSTVHALRMQELFRQTHSERIKNFVSVLSGYTSLVRDYSCMDVVEFLARIDKSIPFFCFPPTYEDGYEKIYNDVEGMIDWLRPVYPVMDGDGYNNFISSLVSRGNFMFGTDRKFGEYSHFLCAQVDQSLRKTLYIYSDLAVGISYLRAERDFSKAKSYRFSNGDIKDVQFSLIDQPTFLKYKAMFLRKVSHYSQSDMYPIAFYDQDGGLIGFASFGLDKFGGRNGLYMMSDFACASFPRASKLLLMIVSSKEFFDFMSILSKKRVLGFSTTAFSSSPVSMKYRGVFKLTKRDKIDTGYKLNYVLDKSEVLKSGVIQKWKTSVSK